MDFYGLASNDRSNTWIGSNVGDYELTEAGLGRVLSPFSAHRENLVVMSGISSESSIQTKDATTHDKITSQALCGSRMLNGEVGSIGKQMHASIDVRIGQHLSGDYGLPYPRVYPHLTLSDYAEPDKTCFAFDESGNQIRTIAGASNIVSTLFGGGGGDNEGLALDAESQNIALQLVRDRLGSTFAAS